MRALLRSLWFRVSPKWRHRTRILTELHEQMLTDHPVKTDEDLEAEAQLWDAWDQPEMARICRAGKSTGPRVSHGASPGYDDEPVLADADEPDGPVL